MSNVASWYPLKSSQDPCTICLETSPPLWGHDGGSGVAKLEHPIHPECAKTWLVINSSCPSCKIRTTNDFVTTGEKVALIAQSTVESMGKGAQYLEGTLLYGLLTVGMIAALELSGYGKAKEVIVIAGLVHGLSALNAVVYSLYKRCRNISQIDSDGDVLVIRISGAIVAALAGVDTLRRSLPVHPLPLGLGVLFFTKMAGFKRVALGAAIGGVIADCAAKTFTWIGMSERVAGAVAGASTALVQYQTHHPVVTAMCARSAWTAAGVAHSALGSYSSVWLVGAVAGAWAMMSTRLIQQSYQQVYDFVYDIHPDQ